MILGMRGDSYGSFSHYGSTGYSFLYFYHQTYQGCYTDGVYAGNSRTGPMVCLKVSLKKPVKGSIVL